jgi:predicted RNase H-like HicB family nuclease
MLYKVILCQGEDGYVVAECPAIAGCVSQGKTSEEALKNIREAIELCLECYREDGQAAPADTTRVVEVAV